MVGGVVFKLTWQDVCIAVLFPTRWQTSHRDHLISSDILKILQGHDAFTDDFQSWELYISYVGWQNRQEEHTLTLTQL